MWNLGRCRRDDQSWWGNGKWSLTPPELRFGGSQQSEAKKRRISAATHLLIHANLMGKRQSADGADTAMAGWIRPGQFCAIS